MSQPALKAVIPPPATGPSRRTIQKGELVFREGDASRSMYLVKKGLVRIFKKKGESFIEIDTIHTGQVLGELAFLDGNPRSASAEAMTEVELVEIGGSTFTQVLGSMPDWLKVLLKTVVARLRAASTKIRQLETASTAINYGPDVAGKKNSHYVFMSVQDAMKLLAAILCVAIKGGESREHGRELHYEDLERYATGVVQIPSAKLAAFLDLLIEIGAIKKAEVAGSSTYFLPDAAFVDSLALYLADENQAEPSKRHDLTPRGHFIMQAIAGNLKHYELDEKTGKTKVNIADVAAREGASTNKVAFRVDEFAELVKKGYGTEASIASATEAYTLIDAVKFKRHARFQRLMMLMEKLNEQKRR